MPFGLKNAGATYQRMTRIFRDKIGRTIEVYIGDMVVESKQEVAYRGSPGGIWSALAT